MTVPLVQPYDPAWPSNFQEIAAFLSPALDGLPYTLEHVGSTAIPGMVAKPIIDIDVVVPPGTFLKARGRLELLGYAPQGDLGIPKREAFDLSDTQAKAHLPQHHLYVCDDGAYELQKHLAFRDFMKLHPQWRERLNRLKLKLCEDHNNDRQAYIDGKAAMVEEITKLAMESSEQGDQ